MKARAFSGVSPVVDSWLLMSSSMPLMCIFLGYFIIVFLIAPKLMKGKSPLNLTLFTRIYNIAQVIICSWIVKWSHADFGLSFRTVWKCLDDSIYVNRMIEYKTIQWWFLILRLTELIETVVFVLRKKQNQVSMLHVYHHLSTATIVWIFMKYCDCELKKKSKKSIIEIVFSLYGSV